MIASDPGHGLNERDEVDARIGFSRALRRACTLLSLLVVCGGCRERESPDAARDRTAEAFLEAQIQDLGRLIAKVESGELVTRDRMAIGVSEGVVKALLAASLPREAALADRVRVRVESAEAYFRGNNALVVFQAVARDVNHPGVGARLEIGASLEKVRIKDGTLVGDVELRHFKALDTSLGDMGADVLEGLVGENQAAIRDLLPTLEIPVHLEQSVTLPGLNEGVVTTRSGTLPLEVTVAVVIPVRQRLWVLLDAKAGPWQRPAAGGASR